MDGKAWVFLTTARWWAAAMLLLCIGLSGCTLAPKIAHETGVGSGSYPFERVVLILNPGVLDRQVSFGRPHADYFGEALKQALASLEVPAEVVTVTLMEPNQGALAQALRRTMPTHLLRMSAVRRAMGGSGGGDRVEWFFQVDHKRPLPGGGATFINLYKFTVSGDSCVVSRWAGEEPLHKCMQTMASTVVEQLLNRAFIYQVRPLAALPAPSPPSEEKACVRPPPESPGATRPRSFRPV